MGECRALESGQVDSLRIDWIVTWSAIEFRGRWLARRRIEIGNIRFAELHHQKNIKDKAAITTMAGNGNRTNPRANESSNEPHCHCGGKETSRTALTGAFKLLSRIESHTFLRLNEMRSSCERPACTHTHTAHVGRQIDKFIRINYHFDTLIMSIQRSR